MELQVANASLFFQNWGAGGTSSNAGKPWNHLVNLEKRLLQVLSFAFCSQNVNPKMLDLFPRSSTPVPTESLP
jgi:hypothetical protein